jgi:hypothetical protein
MPCPPFGRGLPVVGLVNPAGSLQEVRMGTGVPSYGVLPEGLRAAACRQAAECLEGAAYDTVVVPLRHGLETVDILRLRGACGAVRHSTRGTRLLFLVPAGTADRWHLPGTSCTSGCVIAPAADPCWLFAPSGPDGTLRPTDPWVLRSALCEAACTLTAGGLGPY